MRKVVAAINMTLDGVCDHTAVNPDEQIHQHYADLISSSDTVLYGRITYLLMEFWRALVKNPSGEKTMDNFAVVMDRIPKIVFSHTLENVEWNSASLSTEPLDAAVAALQQQSGKDILVGSRSLITQLLKLNLIDEFQLCIHPVIAGKGSPLFENMIDRTILELVRTKIFDSGAVILYYEPTNKRITI